VRARRERHEERGGCEEYDKSLHARRVRLAGDAGLLSDGEADWGNPEVPPAPTSYETLKVPFMNDACGSHTNL
jgi:hypothetical protein